MLGVVAQFCRASGKASVRGGRKAIKKAVCLPLEDKAATTKIAIHWTHFEKDPHFENTAFENSTPAVDLKNGFKNFIV